MLYLQISFSENRSFYEIVWKNAVVSEGQKWQQSTTHVLRIL